MQWTLSSACNSRCFLVMIKLTCSITFQYICLLHIMFYFQRRYIIYIKEVNIYVTTSTHKKLINQTLDSKKYAHGSHGPDEIKNQTPSP